MTSFIERLSFETQPAGNLFQTLVTRSAKRLDLKYAWIYLPLKTYYVLMETMVVVVAAVQ